MITRHLPAMEGVFYHGGPSEASRINGQAVRFATTLKRSPHDIFSTSGFSYRPTRWQRAGCFGSPRMVGPNDSIKTFCTRLAQSGFVAFAPDFYHGRVADNIADAETLAKTLYTNHLRPGPTSQTQPCFLTDLLDKPTAALQSLVFPWVPVLLRKIRSSRDPTSTTWQNP